MPAVIFVLGVVLVTGLVSLIVAWPYHLGVYIAVQRGADQYGADAFMLGWFFESIYIGAILALGIFLHSRRRGEPHVNLWKFWGTLFGTIVVVTSLAYIWPGAPT